MPGFLVEEGGMEKVVIVVISLIYLLKVWTGNSLCVRFVYVKSNPGTIPTKIFLFSLDVKGLVVYV